MKKKIPFIHIKRTIGLLDGREKRRLLIVMIASICMGIIEIIGVGSIMPFMAVASNPELIDSNQYLNYAYTLFNFSNPLSFLVTLGVIMLLFIVFRNVFSAFLMYLQVRFTQSCRHNLSLRLFKTYLGQDYSFFLGRNSYEFVKNIINEIQNVIQGTIYQLINILTYGIQILLLGAFLFVVNPFSTLFIFILITFIYIVIFLGTKQRLNKLGRERYQINTTRNKIVSEAFWGIKDVKISGIESFFYNSYKPASRKLSKNEAMEEAIGVLPKYALETAGFSAIIVFVLITILKTEGSFSEVISTISMYAYAGYRLLPVIQQFFRSITKLKYSASGTNFIIKEFELKKTALPLPSPNLETLAFNKSIELKNIIFTYPNKDKPVINNVSLTIKQNSLVGFCGTTGSGKTTVVDIILGLLQPDSGNLIIDEILITQDNIRSWQKNIGYVPQNIYLSNASIAENVAFGIPIKKIDMEAVKRACQMAQIDTFIESELEDTYHSKIGERGINLSGGQRQRLGIARALYHNPKVLVLDEATSALDNQTEIAVMDAIHNLSGKKTIILIAHRISTLKDCDVIFEIIKGKIRKQGKYAELFGIGELR